MGSSHQETTQQSQTSPWSAAMPEVQGLLSGVQNLIPTSGINPTQQGAINQLTSIGQNGNPYASGTQSAVDSMLAGGGATAQAPAISTAYQNYYNQTNPLASNTNYDPMATPGLGTALQATNDAITQQINGQFAGAGRFGSAANSRALATGLAQGEAPLLLGQYNTNVANQQGAANNLYGAGNTTAGLLSNLNQQGVNNQNMGINNVGTALSNSTWGPQTILDAQRMAQSIPASNLGLLANIGIPLAELGRTANGTTNSTSTPSVFQDIGMLGGIGSFNPATKAGSGLMGLLGMI